MNKVQNELLAILWDTNGYNTRSESQARLLSLFKNLMNISLNIEDFEKKVERLRNIIISLPEVEIKLFENMLNQYKEENDEYTSN